MPASASTASAMPASAMPQPATAVATAAIGAAHGPKDLKAPFFVRRTNYGSGFGTPIGSPHRDRVGQRMGRWIDVSGYGNFFVQVVGERDRASIIGKSRCLKERYQRTSKASRKPAAGSLTPDHRIPLFYSGPLHEGARHTYVLLKACRQRSACRFI